MFLFYFKLLCTISIWLSHFPTFQASNDRLFLLIQTCRFFKLWYMVMKTFAFHVNDFLEVFHLLQTYIWFLLKFDNNVLTSFIMYIMYPRSPLRDPIGLPMATSTPSCWIRGKCCTNTGHGGVCGTSTSRWITFASITERKLASTLLGSVRHAHNCCSICAKDSSFAFPLPGLYTAWLLPAAVVGILVFLYGCITFNTNIPA